MRFVVLDIEWKAEPTLINYRYDIIQIGAAILDDNLHTKSTFYRLVRRKHEILSKDIMYYMHLKQEDFIDAVNFKEAWDDFLRWVPDEFTYVIWSDDIFKVLIQNCNKYKLKIPDGRNVNVHQLFNKMLCIPLIKQFTFGKSCNFVGTVCDFNKLHYSSYDVKCLTRLFRKLLKEGSRRENMLYYPDLQKKKLHIEKCEENKQGNGISFVEAISKGLVPCGCCGDYFKNVHLSERNEIIENVIRKVEKFCRKHEFTLMNRKTEVIIETHNATWRFDLTDPEMSCYHIKKRFFHMERKMEIIITDNSMNMLEIILCTIENKENTMNAGVGNKDIEGLLKDICLALQ